MTDIVDKKTRSRMMSGIQGKNTKPELIIRSLLHRKGFRFRIHNTSLPGKPDIVLKKYNAVVFVHGCFWHKHECHLFKWPKSRPDFWSQKINGNYINDKKVVTRLSNAGWRICIVWECSIKGVNKDIPAIATKLAKWLNSEQQTLEISG